MPTIDRQTPMSAVLAQPDAAAILEARAPEVLDSPMISNLVEFPAGPLLRLILGSDDPRVDEIVSAIGAFEDLSVQPPDDAAILPDPNYEAESVDRSSATVEPPTAARVHERCEIVLHGPSHGNPFVDVDVSARFQLHDVVARAGGFYDGDGMYRVRFLPPEPGAWEFVIESNARSLDGIAGSFDVAASDAPGPVRADGLGFTRPNGTPFIPIGTTAYAWTHQDESLQEETLRSLASAPFNKLRMCLFPKSFMYNSNEPNHFVFPTGDDGGWDTTRFDLDYFAHLETRIEDLASRGIEADLILFHPYDRWGFAALGAAADDRYVSYVVRRLSAFPNVWWSIANEYDLLAAKRAGDWDRLAGLVQANDPVGHPLSIHNWLEVFDYSKPWATHCSLQRGEVTIGASIAGWRKQWGKPVVVDEFGYEGDLDQGWGNLTAEEVVQRFWDGTVHGGYLTHGETYYSADEVIWWSKGGTFQGESQARLSFLRDIVAASPTGRLEPLLGDWDCPWGGVAERYVLMYFGSHRPAFRDVKIPEGMTARIDVIDTWNMTVAEMPGEHAGTVRVELPARPYTAIRLRAVEL